jgi:ATP-binding cassette subfamily C protein
MCIGVINNFIMLITDLVVTLLMGCLAFYASKSGFLIALFIIVVIYFFVNGPVQRKAKNYGSKLRNTQLKLGQEILENISGIKEIKTYGKEDSIYLEFLKLKSIHSTVGQRSIWINTIVRYFLEIAILLIGFFLILFLTMTTDVRHSVTIVVVFMSIGFRLIPNIQRIQNAFVTFKMSTEMTSTLFELEKSFSDKFPLLIDSKEVNVRKKLKSINLRNVGFSYENAISPSVSGVNLKILAGQCLVIVGKSGSGKTTLVDIIAGLNAPSAGTIDYEFTEPEAGNGAVKPTISYVSQGSSLFGEDVYQNVSLSTLSSAIERKIIDDIAVEFELSFLRTEQSLGREIRSDGTNLSGGERQRVALARAKYFNSDLVIFDEPTSSLDPHNAEIVLKYMRSLRGISTMVIVTHSKDLMDLADLVLELENSEVKFCGEVAHYLTRKED